MGRELTTPVDQVDVGYQTIDAIHFEIPHGYNATSGKVEMNKPSIRVDVSWTNWGTDGTVISRRNTNLHYPEWPAAFVTEANDLYVMIENWLETQGFILGAGTTEAI